MSAEITNLTESKIYRTIIPGFEESDFIQAEVFKDIKEQVNDLYDSLLLFEQFKEFQDNIKEPLSKENEFGSSVIPRVTIQKVEIIKRGDNYGTKAVITFLAKNSENGKPETIETGFISYNGYDKSKYLLELDRSNTLFQIATDNIGKEVVLHKVVLYAEGLAKGNKVKQLYDIDANGDNKPKATSRSAAPTKQSASRGVKKVAKTKTDALSDTLASVQLSKDDFDPSELTSLKEALAADNFEDAAEAMTGLNISLDEEDWNDDPVNAILENL